MVFRAVPPKEVVEGFLQALGLQGLHDLRWFSKDELRLDTQGDWLPSLEPYYMPCKAERFLHRGLLDAQDCITVLKHCLKEHGYRLKAVERVYNGRKQPLYQIQARATPTATSLEVTFV
jgi:hypothetical protein